MSEDRNSTSLFFLFSNNKATKVQNENRNNKKAPQFRTEQSRNFIKVKKLAEHIEKNR